MKTKYLGVVFVTLVIAICITGIYWFTRSLGEISIDQDKLYPVTYVVDGDTFKARINSKNITVRVLGINTPETVDPRRRPECFGKEASDEAKGFLGNHKVKLHFNPHRELKDKYGRYLAYVYRDDGIFFNEYMLKGGFAHEYTYGSAYSFQQEFRSIELEARNSGKGLWGMCK